MNARRRSAQLHFARDCSQSAVKVPLNQLVGTEGDSHRDVIESTKDASIHRITAFVMRFLTPKSHSSHNHTTRGVVLPAPVPLRHVGRLLSLQGHAWHIAATFGLDSQHPLDMFVQPLVSWRKGTAMRHVRAT
jgi:hypothetical protein